MRMIFLLCAAGALVFVFAPDARADVYVGFGYGGGCGCAPCGPSYAVSYGYGGCGYPVYYHAPVVYRRPLYRSCHFGYGHVHRRAVHHHHAYHGYGHRRHARHYKAYHGRHGAYHARAGGYARRGGYGYRRGYRHRGVRYAHGIR